MMPRYFIKNMNEESVSILAQCQGKVVTTHENWTLVEVPPGRGFVYLHNEAGISPDHIKEAYHDRFN